MKKVFLFLSFCFCLQAYPESKKTLKPKPDKVVVYLSGAELSYSETIALQAGTNEIILEGVSPYADEQTISAFIKGALVMDSKKGVRYPEAPKVFDNSAKFDFFINRITDSLVEMGYLIKDYNNKKLALQKEKHLLLNNRLMKGEYLKDSLPLLKASLDLLHARLYSIDEEDLSLEKKSYKVGQIIAQLKDRQQYYQNLKSNNGHIQTEQYNPIYQILVSVIAETAITSTLELKYYVTQAGWMPRYDILAGSGQEKLQLVHRAQVYQNSGVEWKDVKLTLSTSNPALGNTKPLLHAWNLVFGYPQSYTESLNKKRGAVYNYNQMNSELSAEDVVTSDAAVPDVKQLPREPIFTMGENFLRNEYDIKSKYSVSSDNKAHHVIVSSMEVPITLTYMAVPKLEQDAFLMAKIVNWEDLNLLPASARIYFDESYIGLTMIDAGTTRDTLYMNLGRDRSIVVKRESVKEKCKEQVLSDHRVISKTFEITIRNTKSIDLDFELEDQIPISSDPNIKISLEGKDGAIYNPITGKLTWKLNVKPKGVKKIQFSYEVKYPKDKYIHGL